MKQVDASLFAGLFLSVGLSLCREKTRWALRAGMGLGFMTALLMPVCVRKPLRFSASLRRYRFSMNWSWWKILAISVLLVLWGSIFIRRCWVAVGACWDSVLYRTVFGDRPDSNASDLAHATHCSGQPWLLRVRL